ncbi:MAG: hypothetical protein J5529_05550 [Prevotella sp.]|nr:hypothetical protein [Prevotella sp.]
MRMVFITREERFSPNSVERDAAIAQAVVNELAVAGVDVRMVGEGELSEWQPPFTVDVWLSMGRLPSTTAFLRERERLGEATLNSGSGVEACTRVTLHRLMRDNHLPMPPDKGSHGYWVKRGDSAAQQPGDVVYCPDEDAADEATRQMLKRGVGSVVVSAHVVGDLVKFYGVEGADFFHTSYPAEEGFSKFGDEERNGPPRHHPFDATFLRAEAERLSRLLHVPVYGGDCIVTQEGDLAMIDFNDWPSFAPCRKEAARAIAARAVDMAKKEN